MGAPELDGFIGAVLERLRPLSNCKVLLDFEATTLMVGRADLDDVLAKLVAVLPADAGGIAIVAPPQREIVRRLRCLEPSLRRRSLKIAVFENTAHALAWLNSPDA
jgi:hypothetical protein